MYTLHTAAAQYVHIRGVQYKHYSYFVSAELGLGGCLRLSQHCIKKLYGLSPRANYTDRATAVCRRSDCQLLRLEGVT
jgi:hypothetical protein